MSARRSARPACASGSPRTGTSSRTASTPRHFSPAPGPIDPGHSSPAPADPTGTTDTTGTSPATAGDTPHAPHAPLVVCVGRLCRQKGQDVLLRAWGPVAERVPGARLVLVGDGPDHDRLRDLAPPSVAFTGAVADPLPWYRAADVVVLPSRWEGMALAPLEAMACARPVVAADVGG
ncbi:glycosyltransferase family 4 protein, partial [Streptomyces sp. Tu 6176]|uniref:glycosyltransferase family 4 protein n=1 Tax=Streptomyces sp. Tu 6176 TaxID=1470557 RepID=UPI003B63C250